MRKRWTSKTVRKGVAGVSAVDLDEYHYCFGVAGGKEVVDGRLRSRFGCGPDDGQDVGRSEDVAVEVAGVGAVVAAGVVVVIVVSAVPVAAGVSGLASLLGCCRCPWRGLGKERLRDFENKEGGG